MRNTAFNDYLLGCFPVIRSLSFFPFSLASLSHRFLFVPLCCARARACACVCLCMCVFLCVCVFVSAGVLACAWVRARVCVCVRA